MSMEPIRRLLLSADDFERMVEIGILGPDVRVELVEGELIEMASIGARLAFATTRLLEVILPQTHDNACVWVRGPLRLSDLTVLYPDLVLLRSRNSTYRDMMPQTSDALLVVEASDTTLGYDQGRKVPLYARHGVPEVWIVNLAKGVIEAFRQPSSDSYDEIRRYGPGDTIAPALLPECAIRVGEILG